MKRTPIALFAAALLLGLPPAYAQEADTLEEAAEPSMSAEAQVMVTEGEPYGAFLVDGEGNALYLFEADSEGESACYDDCAGAWPPFTAEGEPAAGDGADAAMLGTLEREDGTMQVTYGGHPLYYFVQDQAPGDTNGQGVEGFGAPWYLVTPDGSKVEAGGESDYEE